MLLNVDPYHISSFVCLWLSTCLPFPFGFVYIFWLPANYQTYMSYYPVKPPFIIKVLHHDSALSSKNCPHLWCWLKASFCIFPFLLLLAEGIFWEKAILKHSEWKMKWTIVAVYILIPRITCSTEQITKSIQGEI